MHLNDLIMEHNIIYYVGDLCMGGLLYSESSVQCQTPIRVFMDDLTFTTEFVLVCRWILQGLEKLMECPQMSFKPAKSRSMVVRRGKVNRFQISVSGTTIPTITNKPVNLY